MSNTTTRNTKRITPVRLAFIFIVLVVVVTFGAIIGRYPAAPPTRAQGGAIAQAGDCWELFKNSTRVFADGCDIVTPTPEPTPTATAQASETPTASATATFTPTATVAPTATGTPTATATIEPTPAGHVDTEWHPLAEAVGHHHGVNPADYVDVFGEPLVEYLATYGSISYPWATPNENLYKHVGYVWLYDEAEGGCELFNHPGAPCVTHVLVQVHSIGTPLATEVRFHSQYAFVRQCDGDECGVTGTGGWADYGILHAPYKQAWHQLPSDPPGWDTLTEQQQLGQTPYRSLPVEFTPGRVISTLWNSLGPNPLALHLFPHDPNHILGLAWTSPDMWSTLDGTTPGGEYNHSRFHIFSVRTRSLPDAPFIGWTDRWGHVVEGCTEAGLDCVPLVVTAGTPTDETAWLNRQVNQGNPDLYSPAQEFDVFCDSETCGWIKPPPPIPMDPAEMLEWQLEAVGETE